MADIQKLNVNGNIYDISTTWEKVTGKPTTFPPDSHTHSYLPLRGGTIKGNVYISGNDVTNVPFNILTPSAGNTGYIRFGAGTTSSTELGHIGFSAKGVPAMNYQGVVNILLHSGNYNSYAPTLTGTGASGTWGINISGNAATATNASNATNADKLDGYHHTSFAKTASPNNLLHSGNEFTYVGPAYEGIIWHNYRTSSGGADGNIREYYFGNGHGGYDGVTLWAGNFTGNSSSATKLTTDAGSATNPIYFSGGKPVACTYSLNKTVPSNAVFTDTNTWRPVTNTYTGSDQSTCVSQYGTNALYNALVNGYASSAGTSTYASRLGDSSSYYTKSSLDTALNGKANSSHGTHVSGTSFSSGNSGSAEHNCNSITSNGHWYYNSNGPSGLGENSTDGALYSQAYSNAWVGQIAQDYRNGNLFTRGKSNGTWTAWKAVSYNGHTHTKSQITDFPSSMPASDVYSWAKASTKPTYTYSEVGAAAASHTHSYLPLSGGTLTGMVTMKKSSASGNAMYWIETTNSNHYLGFGEGTSGNRGIYDKNLGWVFKIDTSNNVIISGNASTATSATKLQDNTAFTAWGQTFFENGKPKNVSGDLSMGWSEIYWNGDIEGSYISSNGMTEITYEARDGHSFCVDGDMILNISKYGYKLQVNGETNIRGDLIVDGEVSASKGFYQSSDERLKIFYDPIKVDLDKLSKLRKNYFKFNDKDKLEIGVSAQEVQSIYPEIVSENSDGYLSVAYDKLSVIALAAIDELDNKYKKEINDLKDQLEAIKNILNEKGIL